MHDHSTRGVRFCPMMKEMCIKGWTKSMGEDEKTGERPICAAWQPVTTYTIKEGKHEEVHDCSVFGWGPDLLTEIAKEVGHGAASTDKVASEVQKHKHVFMAALSPDAQDRVLKTPLLPEGTNGNTKPD